jgi:small conductance mechanosensitive channel
VLSLLAGVGILGLALGLTFQDLATNLIAGILLSVRRPIHVGDVIETNDFLGTRVDPEAAD